MSPEEIELLLQEVDGHKWPCLCGGRRIQEIDLLCSDCWEAIPAAKRHGYSGLDRNSEESHMAAEQILRIAQHNLNQSI